MRPDMEFRIADTFTESLAKLTGEEQKAAKTTAFDLQLNPAQPGMKFHRVDGARDRNFWSVRVSRGLRMIVHKTASAPCTSPREWSSGPSPWSPAMTKSCPCSPESKAWGTRPISKRSTRQDRIRSSEVIMGGCAVCGSSDESQDQLVDEIFLIDGKYVLVDGIPAKVCPRCGDETFSREIAERIRLLGVCRIHASGPAVT